MDEQNDEQTDRQTDNERGQQAYKISYIHSMKRNEEEPSSWYSVRKVVR